MATVGYNMAMPRLLTKRRDKRNSTPVAPEPPAPSLMTDADKEARRRTWLVALVLAIAVLAVYSRSLRSDFVNWDDNKYVYENVHIQHGLTLESVRWAFTPTWYASNYHPLTWLSHALDIDLFGVGHPGGPFLPWGHHLTNILLHAINTALLAIVLQRLTGRLWPSAVVAALFGLHPAHVESVAWISERKDVLSTLFMFLCLWAYVAWVRRPSPRRYAMIIATLVLSLLAKPMAVTLPAVMLLLDFWPLKRLSWHAVLEKLPLAVIIAGSCGLTFAAQHLGGATRSWETLDAQTRITHAAYAYAMYLLKAFVPWPGTLVPYYPLPDRGGAPVTPWVVLIAAVVVTALTALAVTARRRRPFVTVGWLLYVGMLVPVIGLVQVGTQIMADRYLYVPALGLFIAVVWLAADAVRSRPRLAAATAAAAVVVLGTLGWLTWRQQQVWSSPLAFWSYVVDRYPESGEALNQLGRVYTERKEPLLAIEYYRAAVEAASRQAKPGQRAEHVGARTNLGNRYFELGEIAKAKEQFSIALRANPRYGKAHNGMAMVLQEEEGKTDEVLAHLRLAAKYVPEDYRCHRNLAATLLGSAKSEADLNEAIEHLRIAIRLNPRLPELYKDMAEAYARKGDSAEANRYFEMYRQLFSQPRR